MRLAVVYRPPPSKKNELKTSQFLEEWPVFMTKHATSHKETIIVGDLNFHLNVKEDPETRHFLSLLSSCGLHQHVQEPTHVSGNTLHVIITQDTSTIVSNITVTDPVLCDHSGRTSKDHWAVNFSANVNKPRPEHKVISFRKFRAINVDAFIDDIMKCPILHPSCKPIEELVEAYNDGLRSLIDTHAPLRTKTIVQRPKCSWYTEDLHDAKHLRRKLERKWRGSKLTIDHQIYRNQCIAMNKMLKLARVTFYSDKITACGHDQKGIFKISKTLLGDKGGTLLPQHSSAETLANNFSDFFVEKIVNIRQELQENHGGDCIHDTEQQNTEHPLDEFASASQEEVRTIIMRSPDKSCELDPIPTWLLKKCIDALLPIVTLIVNTSLESSCVPKQYKHAYVRPLF